MSRFKKKEEGGKHKRILLSISQSLTLSAVIVTMSLSKCLISSMKLGVTHIYETRCCWSWQIIHFHNGFWFLIVLSGASTLPHSAHQSRNPRFITGVSSGYMCCTHNQNLCKDLWSRIKTSLKTDNCGVVGPRIQKRKAGVKKWRELGWKER